MIGTDTCRCLSLRLRAPTPRSISATMNAPVKTPALDVPPEWSLADLYAGRADPRIELDLTQAKAANDALVALKGRFVASRADASALGALIRARCSWLPTSALPKQRIFNRFRSVA